MEHPSPECCELRVQQLSRTSKQIPTWIWGLGANIHMYLYKATCQQVNIRQQLTCSFAWNSNKLSWIVFQQVKITFKPKVGFMSNTFAWRANKSGLVRGPSSDLKGQFTQINNIYAGMYTIQYISCTTNVSKVFKLVFVIEIVQQVNCTVLYSEHLLV